MHLPLSRRVGVAASRSACHDLRSMQYVTRLVALTIFAICSVGFSFNRARTPEVVLLSEWRKNLLMLSLTRRPMSRQIGPRDKTDPQATYSTMSALRRDMQIRPYSKRARSDSEPHVMLEES